MGKYTTIMTHEQYAEDKIGYFNEKKSRVEQFFQISKLFGTQEFVIIELTRLTTITTDLKIEEVLQNAESD